jgi:hypothetical protein
MLKKVIKKILLELLEELPEDIIAKLREVLLRI